MSNWQKGSVVYLTERQIIFFHQSFKNGDKIEKLVLFADNKGNMAYTQQDMLNSQVSFVTEVTDEIEGVSII